MKKILHLPLFSLLIACGASPATPGEGADASSDPDGATVFDGSTEPATCAAAKEALLKPVDSASTATVTVLSEVAGVKTLYIDATAGGAQAQAKNPRVYVDLALGARVAVTDVTAAHSKEWDLALKRPVLFVNSGDGGPGAGGAVFVAKDFAAVTAADAAATFAKESFLSETCEPHLDQTGAVVTSFDGWYDYDASSNRLSPKAGTWIVRGGSGRVFKVKLLSYYASADGGAGPAGGNYTLTVAPLE